MADLGRLVVNLEANIAQFTQDMQRASQVTEQTANKISGAVDLAGKALGALGIALSVDLIVSEVNRSLDSLAALDDMAQKTGSSVETLSKLSKVAAFTGTDLGAVDGMLVKLSKNLNDVDEKGNKTAKALAAIGISTNDLKGKDAAQVFVDITNKLQDYEDGAGKVALVTDLMGKSAADMLPFMNDVSESLDDFAADSAEAAAQAAAYQDELAKTKLKYDELVTSIVVDALPATHDFIGALKDVSQESTSLTGISVDSWAEDVAVGLARVVDVAVLLPRLLSTIGGSFKAVGADIEFLVTAAATATPQGIARSLAQGINPVETIRAALDERNAVVDEANRKLDDLWNLPANRMEQAILGRIDDRKNAQMAAGADALAGLVPGDGKPKSGEKATLKYGGGDDGSAAKSALQAQIADIERVYKQEQDQLVRHERAMNELRGQGLIGFEYYNEARLTAIDEASAAAVRAYDAEIKALEGARAKAKDADARDAINLQIKDKSAAKEKALRDAQAARTQELLEQGAAQSYLTREMEAWSRQQDRAISQMQFSNDLYGKSALETEKLTNARRAQLEVDEKIRRAQQQGAVSQEAIERFRKEAKDKADAANAAATKGAALGIIASQKMPWQNEADEHSDRIAALQSAIEQELITAADGHRAIEEENRRHNEIMESMRLSAAQNVLSIAQSSADQLYDALKAAGMEQTALGKAMFWAQKAIQVATIIVNTEVAAAAAQAGLIAAAGATAAVSGPAGPAILAAGVAAGAAYATATRVMGYATAGLVAGTAIASAEGGYDIPAGVNPVTQLHEKEMVLPKAQAEVIRGLAANGGAGGGMKVTIVNQTTGRIDNVIEQRISPTERALIIQEAVAATASTLGDPNSKTSRAMSRNFNVARTRS